MSRRLSQFTIALMLASGALIAFASSAGASFHLNLIREVHEGNGVTGDYVELQSRAAGENLVAGKHILSYDAGGGSPLTNFTIPANASNGANQATILIASTPSVNGVTADFNAGADLNVDNTGGTVCYTDSSIAIPLDCVAFDGTGGADVTVPAFTPAQFGAPFALPGANLDNESLIRTISNGCATSLDQADDTNSAADFTLGAGTPRNNSATPAEAPCPPAKNKKKCKKHKKKKSGAYSAKKKCKKKKHHAVA
jgi:hypothetical protein